MQYVSGYQGNFNPAQQAKILSGASLSAAINCGGFVLCGILLPAAFTGTSISFEASIDGMTYSPVHSTTSGTLLSYTVAQGTYAAIDPKDFQGVNFLKILSGGTEAADRILTCALKGF